MSIKNTCLLVAVFGLAGCTWSHPYKGEAEFNRDKWDCQMAVNQSIPQPRQISPQEYAAMNPQQRANAGMYSSGQQMGTGINQSMMFNSCMKSKGWQ